MQSGIHAQWQRMAPDAAFKGTLSKRGEKEFGGAQAGSSCTSSAARHRTENTIYREGKNLTTIRSRPNRIETLTSEMGCRKMSANGTDREWNIKQLTEKRFSRHSAVTESPKRRMNIKSNPSQVPGSLTAMNLPPLCRTALTPGLSLSTSVTRTAAGRFQFQKDVRKTVRDGQNSFSSFTLMERGSGESYCGCSRHHPAWLSPLPSPFLFFLWWRTHAHWGYWRTGSTSVCFLGAVDVGVCDKRRLFSVLQPPLLSPFLSPPPSPVLLLELFSSSPEESCEAEKDKLWACLSEGKGVAAWWDTLDYPGWLFSAPSLKLKLCAVFSQIILGSTILHPTPNTSVYNTCHHIPSQEKKQSVAPTAFLSSCQLTASGGFKEIGEVASVWDTPTEL